MEFVTTLHRNFNDWFQQKEIPKWLTVFVGQKLPQIVMLVLTVLIAQRAAELTWRFVPEPSARQIISQQEIQKEMQVRGEPVSDVTAEMIAKLHLFGIAGSVKSAPTQQVDKKAPETNLKLTLHGVFVDKDPEAGAAIIGKAGSKQDYYKVGNNVMDGVKLQAVFNDRVVLLRKGQSEVLKFPKTVKPTSQSNLPSLTPQKANPESLSSYREIFRNEPLKIFEHVRFVPVRSGKTTKGYRILPQKNRKLYNKLGIRPSDLVTSVNGVSLQNEKEALQLMNTLKDANQINLEVVRRGKTQSITLDLN